MANKPAALTLPGWTGPCTTISASGGSCILHLVNARFVDNTDLSVVFCGMMLGGGGGGSLVCFAYFYFYFCVCFFLSFFFFPFVVVDVDDVILC